MDDGIWLFLYDSAHGFQLAESHCCGPIEGVGGGGDVNGGCVNVSIVGKLVSLGAQEGVIGELGVVEGVCVCFWGVVVIGGIAVGGGKLVVGVRVHDYYWVGQLFQIQTMGGECRKVADRYHHQEFSLIQPQLHPAFGHIFYLRCDRSKTEKAIKRVPCPSQATLSALKKRMEFARECDSNMTLVQIYDYDIIDQYSQDHALWQALASKRSQFSCSAQQNEPFILIHFQYFSPEHCLSQHLKARQGQLQKLGQKYGKVILGDARAVQMWNYAQIDKLSSHARQVANVYYQEIEVIRMIDHIIGAVYFLHHFDVPHSALRPQQLLVDDDGRFVLVDREAFARKSNYQLALQFLQAKQRGSAADPQILNHLAPEYLAYLKNRVEEPSYSHEKADIFCVGLLALSMCLLDYNQQIFEYSPSQRSIRFNEGELTHRLMRMKERYSDSFSDLLQKMLRKDAASRIDFAQLVDELNPLLQANLQAIRKVHSMQAKQEEPHEDTYEYGGRFDEQQLRSRLVTMEKEFQKVMNNRMMLLSRNANQVNLRGEESKILQKLQKIKTARSEMSTKVKSRKAVEVRRGDKRYISGKQLQQIVWKQYQNIKSRRNDK